MSALEHAFDLWRRGLSIIPVPRPDGRRFNGKVPAIGWKEYQQRQPTEDELHQWFATEQNIAVVTGRVSGVVAIDVDSEDAIRWATRWLPFTAWQTRTARGFHLYYRHPSVRVANRARIDTRDGRLEIDVRGDGGYIIAPGSIHTSGARYEQTGDWSVSRDQLPTFWPGWLRPLRRPTSRPSLSRPTGDVIERARRYLATIPPPEIGHGSDAAALSAACRLVRGFSIPESEAVQLLWDWCGNPPGWSRDWVARKVRNAAWYGTEPIGALR